MERLRNLPFPIHGNSTMCCNSFLALYAVTATLSDLVVTSSATTTSNQPTLSSGSNTRAAARISGPLLIRQSGGRSPRNRPFHERCQCAGRRVDGAGEPEHWGPPTPRPLPVHALRPECGRAIGVSKCCGWCRRAPAAQLLGRAQLGTSPPLTSRVRRAAGGAKGPVTHDGAPRRAGRNCSFFLAPTPRQCFP